MEAAQEQPGKIKEAASHLFFDRLPSNELTEDEGILQDAIVRVLDRAGATIDAPTRLSSVAQDKHVLQAKTALKFPQKVGLSLWIRRRAGTAIRILTDSGLGEPVVFLPCGREAGTQAEASAQTCGTAVQTACQPTKTTITGSTSHRAILEGGHSLLYMDAANYTSRFFPHGRPWNLGRASKAVRDFCAAASKDWQIVAFIDQATLSDEAQKKWRKRREKEVRNGERNVPQGALRLLGDMLELCGVEVRYSLEADNDDTIAFHAQADGASILSHDSDFFRYSGAQYTLYKDYEMDFRSRRIKLIEHDGSRKASHRVIRPPPATGNGNPFRDCVEQGYYLRGTPSPLVQLGNIHITVRPLRQALYHKKGLQLVVEEFPVRAGAGVEWNKTSVSADPRYLDFLSNPQRAVEEFTQRQPDGVSDNDWYKHEFALRAVVAEICCEVSGARLFDTLLQLLAGDREGKGKSFRSQGRGKGARKGSSRANVATRETIPEGMGLSHDRDDDALVEAVAGLCIHSP